MEAKRQTVLFDPAAKTTPSIVDRGAEGIEDDLARLARILQRYARHQPESGIDAQLESLRASSVPEPLPGPTDGAPSRLGQLCEALELSLFERDLLTLALSVEADGRFGRVIAALQGSAVPYPSVGFAFSVLSVGPSLRARALTSVSPQGRLLRLGLLQLIGEGPLPTRMMVLPRSLALRLLGVPVAPSRPLSGSTQANLRTLVLTDAERRQAEVAVAHLRQDPAASVAVRGPRGSGRDALAAAILEAAGWPCLELSDVDLEPEPMQALRPEAAWYGAALRIKLDEAPTPPQLARVTDFAAPIVWVMPTSGVEPLLAGGRDVLTVDTSPVDIDRRARIWARLLTEANVPAPQPRADDLAQRWQFGPARMVAATNAAQLRAQANARGTVTAEDLQAACHSLPAGRLGELAQRLETRFTLDDLIVGPAVRRELDLALAWVRHGKRVFSDLGFGDRLADGKGLTCLFCGPPGTGKTLAARVLAHAIGIEMYRVDLSKVVSKYIGETEKNLSRLFEEAEATNAMLFFDEADALFGKRTEVKDAHDRYANIETGFLLQRLELHPGVSVLASNLRDNIDDAFLRRLHVVAEFEMPEASERGGIWRRLLPEPSHWGPDLDIDQLADRFSLSGGQIRNACLVSAFLAADEGAPISMRHATVAIYRELRKSGRLVDLDAFGDHVELLRD